MDTMEAKMPPRMSLEWPGSGSSSSSSPSSGGATGAGPSTIRRLTRSPTHRLNLRRTSSESSSSRASVSSISSDETDDGQSSSCVTRDTARDECNLHRFIVWAAVKRNVCDKMTPEERRECPLLRCRKRFINHEDMLKHLYTCTHLPAGEYWCYDCERVEHFNDAKCKRCLGHPSRRRRIVSLAKHFFSSLGHKSKNPSLGGPDLDSMDEGHEAPPPSYDSLLASQQGQAQAQAELYSNEIHEIDSSEIPLPTILEYDEASEDDDIPLVDAVPEFTLSLPTPADQPLTVHPAELESAPILSDSMINWPSLPDTGVPPDTVAPTNLERSSSQSLFDYDVGSKNPERPVLQVFTHGLEQYRSQAKRRSKMLAPSSSVRSTASTSSTNSTASTNSTNSFNSMASYNISPMSGWSGAWHHAPGFESTLTSPADDQVSLGGLLEDDPFANSCKATAPNSGPDAGAFDYAPSESHLSELPADVPITDALSTIPTTTDPLHNTFSLDQPIYSFHASVPSSLTLDTQAFRNTDSSTASFPHLTTSSTLALEMPQQPLTNPAAGSYVHHLSDPAAAGPPVDPVSLVHAARDALELHIKDTMQKLREAGKNHLATRLRGMTPADITRSGLDVLGKILDGHHPTTAVDLLCFVHVVYAISLVVYEQDAPKRALSLFGQVISYGTWLNSRGDRTAYQNIVDTLWKPPHHTPQEFLAAINASVRSQSSPATPQPNSIKGKERDDGSGQQISADPLLFVAQYFLDQLEYAAIQPSNNPVIQLSQVCLQHIQDKGQDVRGDSPFALEVTFALKLLTQKYPDAPGFSEGLSNILDRVVSCSISTPRRLELELIQTGKMFLPSDRFFDRYIGDVRSQIDQLYTRTNVRPNLRAMYQRKGVDLMKVVTGVASREPTGQSTPRGPEQSLEEFMSSMTPDMVGLDFGTFATPDSMPQTSMPNQHLTFSGLMTDMTIDPYALNNTAFMTTPEGSSSLAGPSTAATSPPTPAGAVGAADANKDATGKVESQFVCEICGYRPKGDPKWFQGSMAKHKKLQHAKGPPKIYRCLYPGCKSEYKNRPDNLRAHQIEKKHFIDGQDSTSRRPSKRKKTE